MNPLETRASTQRANVYNGRAFAASPTSLPRGGGPIRGIGEMFAVNTCTGTGITAVPIATSPGRSGFGPQLSLCYDPGQANGPFGFDWGLSLPAVTRKTDKGLPQDRDAEESDVFILSDAEDLVPVLDSEHGSGRLTFDEPSHALGYRIDRYRPLIEDLFARIERWTNRATWEVHLRSITWDNITTLYGKDNSSRSFDPVDPFPEHPARIFSWLICESYDDKGNPIVYEYAAEYEGKANLTEANERKQLRTANYLKRIKYDNEPRTAMPVGRPPALAQFTNCSPLIGPASGCAPVAVVAGCSCPPLSPSLATSPTGTERPVAGAGTQPERGLESAI